MDVCQMRRLVMACVIVGLAGLSPGQGIAGDKTVFASNYPLAYFAERISGRSEIVSFPRMDGDPAFWKPSAQDVIAMQEADVILLNGADYEKWASRVSLPRTRTVDTSAAFSQRLLVDQTGATHAHGAQGEHAHSGTAFTTWIDFSQAIAQAEAVRDALQGAEIVSEARSERNFAPLRAELAGLDTSLAEVASGLADTPLIGSHPVYQYLARRYGLNLKSVLWEPDSPPTREMWAALEALREEHPASWMIWEGEPLPETAKKLEAMGLRSIVFNPAGNRPEQGDFISVMKANIESIRKISDSGS